MNCIILAGGKSSRMRQNKAFLKINNTTLIENLINKIGNNFSKVIIVTNEPELYQSLPVVITKDIIPAKGPLSGIHAGLIVSDQQDNFIIACDMPNIEWRFAYFLLKFKSSCDVVVPKIKNNYEPLSAIYTKNCIAKLEYCLENGIYKITEFYKMLKVCEVLEADLLSFGEIKKLFVNVNTPEEFTNFRKSLQE